MDMSNPRWDSRLTLITLAWELYTQGVPKIRIARYLGKNREIVIHWIQGIESYGLFEFLERYQGAKRGPRRRRQVDPLIKHWVWEIRERELNCCGQKIQYFLAKEHQTHLSPKGT